MSDTLDILLKFAALIGAGLGIFNFVKAREKERVRLKVELKASFFLGLDSEGRDTFLSQTTGFLKNNSVPNRVGFTITNMSSFPVVLEEVGFLFGVEGKRSVVYDPLRERGINWPNRLPSRESVTVYTEIENVMSMKNVTRLNAVYVTTACGTTAKGINQVLLELTDYAINE